MNDEYLQHYRALNIQPGCNFRDLKDAYRRLVKEWHPDRFTENHKNGDIAYAEEKIREINKAFRSLSDFHKANGHLPSSPRDIDAPDADNAFWPGRSKPSAYRRSQPKKTKAFSFSLRFMLAGAVLGVIFAIWVSQQQDDAELGKHFPVNPPPTTQNHELQLGSPRQKATENYFTVGSTLGDVIAVQGIPSLIQDDVWHYGLSTVYFKKGVVLKWEQDPSSPLKADLFLSPHKILAKNFTLGSTKSEVRAAQGAPLRESPNMWEYRVSRIFFKNDRVSEWYDSPLDPLKIRK